MTVLGFVPPGRLTYLVLTVPTSFDDVVAKDDLVGCVDGWLRAGSFLPGCVVSDAASVALWRAGWLAGGSAAPLCVSLLMQVSHDYHSTSCTYKVAVIASSDVSNARRFRCIT